MRLALEAAPFRGGPLARCRLVTAVDERSHDTPFLRLVRAGTTAEVDLPRPSPRVSVTKLGQQLDEWVGEACGGGSGGAAGQAMPWDVVQGQAWPPG